MTVSTNILGNFAFAGSCIAVLNHQQLSWICATERRITQFSQYTLQWIEKYNRMNGVHNHPLLNTDLREFLSINPCIERNLFVHEKEHLDAVPEKHRAESTLGIFLFGDVDHEVREKESDRPYKLVPVVSNLLGSVKVDWQALTREELLLVAINPTFLSRIDVKTAGNLIRDLRRDGTELDLVAIEEQIQEKYELAKGIGFTI